MGKRFLPLLPLAATAALLMPAAPAGAAVTPAISIYDIGFQGDASLYAVFANSNTLETLVISGTTVISSLPINVDSSAHCSTPVQQSFFGAPAWMSTCSAARGISRWAVTLGGGNDTFVSNAIGEIAVDGSGGDDTITAGSSTSAVTAWGSGGNDKITLGNALGKAKALGGPGHDTLTANRTGSTLEAGAGADTIFAANGTRDVIDCGDTGGTRNADGAVDTVHRDAGVDNLNNCAFDTKRDS